MIDENINTNIKRLNINTKRSNQINKMDEYVANRDDTTDPENKISKKKITRNAKRKTSAMAETRNKQGDYNNEGEEYHDDNDINVDRDQKPNQAYVIPEVLQLNYEDEGIFNNEPQEQDISTETNTNNRVNHIVNGFKDHDPKQDIGTDSKTVGTNKNDNSYVDTKTYNLKILLTKSNMYNSYKHLQSEKLTDIFNKILDRLENEETFKNLELDDRINELEEHLRNEIRKID